MNKFALMSVSDKTGIVDFAMVLCDNNYKILATGNTSKILKENGIETIEIQDYASFPEIFSGRVKTLQPKIFGGILMRRDNESDKNEAQENDISPIDIVCVNLYPFPSVVARTDVDNDTKIENIDIGGPSLIRAAAKNYKHVSVLTNPNQYKKYSEYLNSGEVELEHREQLAAEAFAHTSFYDTIIANYFEDEFIHEKKDLRINFPIYKKLRYGENPHQDAYLFGDFEKYFETLHGKELSYNNIIDLTAAVDLIKDLDHNSCAIIKHTNPCGCAMGNSAMDAYKKALSCDPVSAFGGIVAFKDKVDEQLATKLNEIFLEIICAPEFSNEALEILQKKKNRRLIKILSYPEESLMFKNIPGGVIAQGKDNSKLLEENLRLVTEREYNEEELENLKFAWIVCKHVKSNSIVYVKDKKAVGVGAGQMSRIDSSKIAASKAKSFGHDLKGAVAASDAFFPFADGLEEIAANGVTAVIQPGGSVRDAEVIEAANKNNLTMIFTGIRNFKH